MKRISSFQQTSNRYAALRVIGFIYSLLGLILMAIGGLLLAFGLYALVVGSSSTPPQGAGPFAGPRANVSPLVPWSSATFSLLWSFAFLLSGLQTIALGSLLDVMIHLEENTRATAQILDKIRSRLEPNPEGVEPVFRT